MTKFARKVAARSHGDFIVLGEYRDLARQYRIRQGLQANLSYEELGLRGAIGLDHIAGFNETN